MEKYGLATQLRVATHSLGTTVPDSGPWFLTRWEFPWGEWGHLREASDDDGIKQFFAVQGFALTLG